MFEYRAKLTLIASDGSFVTTTDKGKILKSSRLNRTPSVDGYILPDELTLKWTSRLPPLDEEELSSTITEQLSLNCPFPKNEAIRATHIIENPDKTNTVHFFLASKPLILAHYGKSDKDDQETDPKLGEVWASLSESLLVNLPGFGESSRIRKTQSLRKYIYTMLVCLASLAAATAITPLLQTRIKALSASEMLHNLAAKGAPFIKKRELIARSQLQIDTINKVLGGPIVPLDALDSLSQAMPDTAHLVSFELSNDSSSSGLATVKLNGKAQDTLELIKALISTGVFSDLKLATPVVRQPGTSQEFFSLIGYYRKLPLFDVNITKAADPQIEGKK